MTLKVWCLIQAEAPRGGQGQISPQAPNLRRAPKSYNDFLELCFKYSHFGSTQYKLRPRPFTTHPVIILNIQLIAFVGLQAVRFSA